MMYWIALRPASDTPPEQRQALAWWALQWTAQVAWQDGILLLELSTCLRLWGGRAALLRRMFTAELPVEPVQWAQGATSLIAMARLYEAGLQRTPAHALPLAALAAAQPHLPTLVHLGCTRWGQLRALPRSGVARRFGAPLLDALDRAYAQAPETYAWLQRPAQFDSQIELAAAVTQAAALLFAVRRLLVPLQHWLRLCQRGVLELELIWKLDARGHGATEGRLLLGMAQPVQDMAQVQRLLGERLAQVQLEAPALALRLCTRRTEPWQARNADWLVQPRAPGDSLVQLLERLGARLGAQQVQRCTLRAEHRPEHMQVWSSALDAPFLIAKEALAQSPAGFFSGQSLACRPCWLRAVPQALALRDGQPQYHGVLSLLAGPQRLEAVWWEETPGTLRDYFLAHSVHAGLLWIYRERGSQALPSGGVAARWYLHGYFA